MKPYAGEIGAWEVAAEVGNLKNKSAGADGTDSVKGRCFVHIGTTLTIWQAAVETCDDMKPMFTPLRRFVDLAGTMS
jgi:hypothetical protein